MSMLLGHAALTVKRTAATALHRSGLLWPMRRTALRGRAVVLMYHRVLPSAAMAVTRSHPGIVVSAESFDRQMALLVRHFQPLPLDAFVERLESNRPFEDRSCLVTFDDGWADTYATAWPILAHHSVPATVFMPTRFIGSSSVFWQEEITDLLGQIRARSVADAAFGLTAAPALASLGLGDVHAAAANAREISTAVNRLKGRADTEDGSLSAKLRQLLGGDVATNPVDRFMSWEQAREMAAAGIAFGSHGVSHRLLSALSPEDVRTEVFESRATLEREVPSASRVFCYPNGSWTPGVADIVAEGGYRAAFSTARGTVACGDARFSLRRVNIHEDATRVSSMFLARLLGLW